MKKPRAMVEMPGGQPYAIFDLMGNGEDNAKTRKNAGYVSLNLSMTPWKVDGMPELGNACGSATPECISLCNHISGLSHGDWAAKQDILDGRLARRILFARDRDRFMEMYHYEVDSALRRARKAGMDLVVRLNMFTDFDWMRIEPRMVLDYPDGVRFHDYTKVQQRFRRFMDGDGWPRNYHLTFSRTEENEEFCLEALSRGFNCAVVFDTKFQNSANSHPLPPAWRGYDVVDGDKSDLRFLDPPGVVVGLRAKGRARGPKFNGSSFVVEAASLEALEVA